MLRHLLLLMLLLLPLLLHLLLRLLPLLAVPRLRQLLPPPRARAPM